MTLKKYLPIAISLYLITGFLFTWYNFLSHFNLGHLLAAPFPATLFIIISGYFLYAGIVGLFSNNSHTIFKLQSVALMMQVLQFSFFGFVYANHAGPYIGVGLYFQPTTMFDIDVSIYKYLFSNGYSANAAPYFFLNLFPLLIWGLYQLVIKKNEDN